VAHVNSARMSSTDAVKHVGGWVSETGRPFVENAKRRENAQRKMFAAAQTWTFGGSRIRREACNIKRSVRLTIAKSVVIPTALATCRTRTWNQFMIRRLDQSVKSCLRRCFGLRLQTLHDLHISNEMLRKAAGWRQKYGYEGFPYLVRSCCTNAGVPATQAGVVRLVERT